MAKLQIEKGSTDVSVYVLIRDSSSAVGAGLTGLVYNSAGLTCYYVRPLAAAVVLTLATQTVTGVHSDGGFVEVSSANTPGLYRLDLSDAVCASGVDSVVVHLKGATDMEPVALEIQLTTFDLNDASPEVTLASETHTGAVIPTVTTLTSHTPQTGDNYARLGAPAAASIAADLLAIDNFVDDLETRLSAVRAGYLDNLNGHTPQTGDSYARLGTPAGASVSADIAAVEGQTDDIGVAGAGLTAVPWNAAWDAQVESEVTDALVAYDPPTSAEMDARTLLAANYATVANQTTLLGRIGTFTGSGVNTILGFFQALMRSDATTPSDVGGTYDDATDSAQAIRDRGDAAWTTGAGGSDRLLMVDTTIATLSTQTSFTLTAGSADDDAYVNCTIVVEDISTSTQKAIGVISAYTGASKTVTLKYDPGVFVMATTDKVYILAENSLKSTDQNRQLDVTATGAAGIDWANVENPTTAVDLSSTDIQLTDTVTTNSDMRGTDSAALASIATEGRLAELDAANMPADLDTALTNQTATLDRIGAFTTGGVNNILGFFQALMRSDATTPSDVGGTYDDGTDSLQAVRDRGDTAWTTGAGGTPPDLLQSTTIATLASQISFTLTAGSVDDSAYNGAIAVVTDQSTSTQKAVGIVSSYTGTTKTVALQSDPGIFVMAVGDTIDIVATDMASLIYTAARAGYLDNLNGHTPQTGDSYARIGAPAGASVSADVADIPTSSEFDARTLLAANYFDSASDNVILTAGSRTAIVDDVLDEVLSKSAHNGARSVGKYIRTGGSKFIWEGTAQGPGTGPNQIQLDTGASSVDGAYDPSAISIIDGTGVGQSRLVLQYEGSTRTATVDRDWKVNPDATSEFIVTPDPGRGHVNEGLAQGGTTYTITLNSLASPVDDAYVAQVVFISSGAGSDQTGRITAYNGTTKVATMSRAWTTTPDTTSGYVMLPDSPSIFQGYESAAIWLDTVNGTAGTILYENGTAENPSNSLADTTTLATALGFSRIMVAPGSSVTLVQAYNGFTLGSVAGNGWTLALGGQSISNATIVGATVSGVCSGASPPTFVDCTMGAVTIPASRAIDCAVSGTQTMSGSGDFFYEGCYSGIAGTSAPTLVFSASSNLNFRHYSGGIHIQSMAATNNMSLEGNGQVVLNANCTGGAIAIRGHFTVIDNAGGAVTLSDNARYDIAQINVQADQALLDYDPPTKAEMDGRTLLAASYATAAAQATMQTDLDNPGQYKADVSALALEATLSALLTTQMTESYAADGVAPTLAQALFLIQQSIGDFSISGTTLTAKKIDGSTTAATYTLDDAADPTSRTRAT